MDTRSDKDKEFDRAQAMDRLSQINFHLLEPY